MKLHRKIALALAVPVAASSLLIASPADAFRVDDSVCAIVGSVHLSNGINLANDSGIGTYAFVSTVSVCAGGAPTGVRGVYSTGTYVGPTFNGAFSIGPCTGSVWGSRIGLLVTASASITCPAATPTGTVTVPGTVVLTFIPLPTTMQGTVAYDAAMAGAAAFVAVP